MVEGSSARKRSAPPKQGDDGGASKKTRSSSRLQGGLQSAPGLASEEVVRGKSADTRGKGKPQNVGSHNVADRGKGISIADIEETDGALELPPAAARCSDCVSKGMHCSCRDKEQNVLTLEELAALETGLAAELTPVELEEHLTKRNARVVGRANARAPDDSSVPAHLTAGVGDHLSASVVPEQNPSVSLLPTAGTESSSRRRLGAFGGWGGSSNAQVAPANAQVSSSLLGAWGVSNNSAAAATAPASGVEVDVEPDEDPLSGLGLAHLSIGPLATWVDSIQLFGALLAAIIVCKNIVTIVVLYVVYTNLANANEDMLKLMRRERVCKCCAHISLRCLAVLLFLYGACLDDAVITQSLPMLQAAGAFAGWGQVVGTYWLKLWSLEASTKTRSKPVLADLSTARRAPFVMRCVGFQEVSGSDLLVHLSLGNIVALAGRVGANATATEKENGEGVGATGKENGGVVNALPRPFASSEMLRLIALSDAMVCFLGMFVKAVSLQVTQGRMVSRSLGYLLGLQEALVSLYRQLLPIAMWLPALMGAVTWAPLGHIFAAAYLVIKLKTWISTARLAWVAFNALARKRLPYGTLLQEEGCHEKWGECAVCHDRLQKPLQLACGHVFCDACVLEWLEVTMFDGTCPLCRRVCQPAHLHMSLKGGSWLYPHLF